MGAIEDLNILISREKLAGCEEVRNQIHQEMAEIVATKFDIGEKHYFSDFIEGSRIPGTLEGVITDDEVGVKYLATVEGHDVEFTYCFKEAE